MSPHPAQRRLPRHWAATGAIAALLGVLTACASARPADTRSTPVNVSQAAPRAAAEASAVATAPQTLTATQPGATVPTPPMSTPALATTAQAAATAQPTRPAAPSAAATTTRPAPTQAVRTGRSPTSAGECPDDALIKGNRGSNGNIYHTPGSSSYAQTKAEECFATVDQATAAGYRAPLR